MKVEDMQSTVNVTQLWSNARKRPEKVWPKATKTWRYPTCARCCDLQNTNSDHQLHYTRQDQLHYTRQDHQLHYNRQTTSATIPDRPPAPLYQIRLSIYLNVAKKVFRVQKLEGLLPPHSNYLGVFFRGCRRQPLYCFHFDFRYVTLVRYIYNMCSYA